VKIGPAGGEGFRQIRFFPEHGWSTLDVLMFIWLFVALVMAALWWMDRSRAGAVLRAVGEDEVAAQSAGLNVTAVKVAAMTVGGFIAGLGGGIFAHYTAHIEHAQFGVALATFAIAYPILGGLSSVFGTLIAVVFVQGFLIEGLRFLGDWRNLFVRGPHSPRYECQAAWTYRCGDDRCHQTFSDSQQGVGQCSNSRG